MNSLSDIELQAMRLSVPDRAKLATRLLHSLPSPGFDDDDDGVAESMRRSAEMDADPSTCMTFDELKRSLGR
ncbi:MAG: addiction module protein [Luteolibacter sp.]